MQLSKECRKEMQYYKLLAKEVEKRIALLQPYVFDSCSSSDNEDPTEAPELPECEQNYELSQEETQSDFDINIDKIRNVSPPLRTNETYIENKGSPKSPTSKFFIDVNQNINESPKDTKNSSPRSRSPPSRVRSPPLRDLPERDYNCVKRVTQKVITEKQIITEVETKRNVKRKSRISQDNFAFNEPVSDPFSGIPLPQDGPSSLSSKSFTGSLNDLHSESIKDSDVGSGKLLRQRSYTLLKPSPQLLAHLEVHSQNTGVEMTSISMSESLSNISSPSKKRRSWDLESAKVKWSTMALELKQKNVVNVISKSSVGKNVVRPTGKNLNLQRAKSVTPNTAKRNNINHKPLSKSEPIPNTRKSISPVRNKVNNRSVKTEPVAPRVNEKGGASTKVLATPISESADPAARVRELYEKIQKQQLAQMASLVEKQKREQMLLQQVFEEQNNLLFKQLKTICPKSPIEAKEAWGDQILCEGDRGPVSLSQVINYKSPDQSAFSSPVSTTLNDTSNYINHCDNVLKKSRDITGSLKKPQIKSHSQNGTKIQSPRTEPDGSRTRTHSPARKAATSRRLNYDSSASTDRDYDQILTDRTNDTLADLNVTFPSDHSEEGNGSVIHNKNIVSHLCGKETKTNHGHSGQSNPSIQSRSTENAIKNLERNISSSMNSVSTRSSKPPVFKNPPTSKEVSLLCFLTYIFFIITSKGFFL